MLQILHPPEHYDAVGGVAAEAANFAAAHVAVCANGNLQVQLRGKPARSRHAESRRDRPGERAIDALQAIAAVEGQSQNSRFSVDPADRALPDQVSTLPEDLAKQPFCNCPRRGAAAVGRRAEQCRDRDCCRVDGGRACGGQSRPCRRGIVFGAAG